MDSPITPQTVFDLLQHPPRSPEPVPLGAGVSVVLHAAIALALIGGAGQTILQSAPVSESIISSALRYLLPPDSPGTAANEPAARWSSMQAGQPLPADPNVYNATRVPPQGTTKPEPQDASATQPLEEAAAAQNAFTLQEVDTGAVRDPNSAVPAYPRLLQAQGIEGMAVVRFVVDSTGLADLRTFIVMETNHRLFADAVRDALPRMKFHPATVGPRKVRQMVEIPFGFVLPRSEARKPDR